MNRALPHIVLALGTALALVGCGTGDSTQQALSQAQAKLAATLPKPYVEDLVIESVKVEGHALVEVIRSPLGTAAKTRENPRFNELRQSEAIQLRDWCNDPLIQPLLKTDATLKRRFVDRHDGVFFEVEMAARNCPSTTPRADAAATP